MNDKQPKPSMRFLATEQVIGNESRCSLISVLLLSYQLTSVDRKVLAQKSTLCVQFKWETNTISKLLEQQLSLSSQCCETN